MTSKNFRASAPWQRKFLDTLGQYENNYVSCMLRHRIPQNHAMIETVSYKVQSFDKKRNYWNKTKCEKKSCQAKKNNTSALLKCLYLGAIFPIQYKLIIIKWFLPFQIMLFSTNDVPLQYQWFADLSRSLCCLFGDICWIFTFFRFAVVRYPWLPWLHCLSNNTNL